MDPNGVRARELADGASALAELLSDEGESASRALWYRRMRLDALDGPEREELPDECGKGAVSNEDDRSVDPDYDDYGTPWLPDEDELARDGLSPGEIAEIFDAARQRQAASGGAPLLDTWGITRHGAERDGESSGVLTSGHWAASCFLDRADPSVERAKGPPLEYLTAVEFETAPHRESRAQWHRRAAAYAARGLRLHRDGSTELLEEVEPTRKRDASERAVRWHQGRETGSRERFARVIDCGQQRVSIACSSCGVCHEVPASCACQRLCIGCRDANRKERLARVAVAQTRVVKNAVRRGLLRRGRAGLGAWGQRMITLTVPREILSERWELESIASPAPVTLRIRALFEAWTEFNKRLRKWCRRVEKRDPGRVEWYRGFEWTLGDDGNGHPHFHVWIFSPLIPQTDVELWWRAALEKVGRIASHVRPMPSIECAALELELELPRCRVRARGVELVDGRRTIRCLRDPRVRALREELEDTPRHARRGLCRVREQIPRKRHHALTSCRSSRQVLIVDVAKGSPAGIVREAAKGRIELELDDGSRMIRYLAGWAIVDAYKDSGGMIRAEVLARLYESLEARRITQTSTGLLDPLRVGCGTCGAQRTTRVEVFDPRLEARPTGRCDFREKECRGPP